MPLQDSRTSSPRGTQPRRHVVVWQNNPMYQMLADACLELIENEGAGMCLAASGQQALVAHCARMGKPVPPSLPQNARQMRTQIVDFLVHHRDFYSLDAVWQVGDRLQGTDFDEFIGYYRQTHVFMSTCMMPVFAELMRQWTSDPALGIESPAPRVLHYVPGRPFSHFQVVDPIHVSEKLTEIQGRIEGGSTRTTKFTNYESFAGLLQWQLVLDTDICFLNSFFNLH